MSNITYQNDIINDDENDENDENDDNYTEITLNMDGGAKRTKSQNKSSTKEKSNASNKESVPEKKEKFPIHTQQILKSILHVKPNDLNKVLNKKININLKSGNYLKEEYFN